MKRSFFNSGDQTVVFDDLKVDQAGMNYQVKTSCYASDYNNATITSVSPYFHVHNFPETGLLRLSGTSFTYEGTVENVLPLIENFDSSMGFLACEGNACTGLKLP